MKKCYFTNINSIIKFQTEILNRNRKKLAILPEQLITELKDKKTEYLIAASIRSQISQMSRHFLIK
jgi:hypothetical protein